MVAKKKQTVNKAAVKTADKVALYDKLIAMRPEIERKGDANPYTAVNGNMFTILVGSEWLGIRLPEEERAKFLKKYGTTLLEAYGAVMKEYVAVPDGLLRKTKELTRFLDLSYEYAGALKPKPTAKKK
jgi:TfoX/Sxy family transcriptional regulator of competence genes